MPATHTRGHCSSFWLMFPPLQVAPSFACSVASLSRSPAFQLPGHHHLHGEVLADHQFDWGRLSTCPAAHVQHLLTPSPNQILQELPPSTKWGQRELHHPKAGGRIHGVQVSLLERRLASCIGWCVAVSLHICSCLPSCVCAMLCA